MHRTPRGRSRLLPLFGLVLFLVGGVASAGAATAKHTGFLATSVGEPRYIEAAAFDVSKPLRELARTAVPKAGVLVPERGPTVVDGSHATDTALQSTAGPSVIPPPIANFEGLSNQDNFNIFGFRVNPPDPVGDVGPNHYVEMINLVWAVYSKAGVPLLGPASLGSIWDGFAIPDCSDSSGDPIVLHDQFADRWILTQFTTRGLSDPTLPFYNCVAVSTTSDPTGSYFRYAFITQEDPDGGFFFPDYPKYGVWRNGYLLTTRDFGTVDGYGISVYALEKRRMVAGDPNARAVQIFLDSDTVPINLIGDGLLPPDIDGPALARKGTAAPIVGTQDDEGPYGATFDALNIWDFKFKWGDNPSASIVLADQVPVDEFDSIYPCAPTSRDCLPQPGIIDPNQFLDHLGYRQRPTWRLAYRAHPRHATMVTAQSVEAAPAHSGMRWYELKQHRDGSYSVVQQGTYAPDDGVHRWMGSIAKDKNGSMLLGYSVVNGVDVFPGIRYTGRLKTDPPGTMPLGEGLVIAGTGVQTTTNSRWGDYTSMNIDPVDDCTFWYVNEYYTAEGQASSPAGWQTRIASVKLPGC